MRLLPVLRLQQQLLMMKLGEHTHQLVIFSYHEAPKTTANWMVKGKSFVDIVRSSKTVHLEQNTKPCPFNEFFQIF